MEGKWKFSVSRRGVRVPRDYETPLSRGDANFFDLHRDHLARASFVRKGTLERERVLSREIYDGAIVNGKMDTEDAPGKGSIVPRSTNRGPTGRASCVLSLSREIDSAL